MEFIKLNNKDIPQMLTLIKQLNPMMQKSEIINMLDEMFTLDYYHCFGYMVEGHLIGISSAWITVRLYSGKQCEIDNFVIDAAWRSKGIGAKFLIHIETWAQEQGCHTVELNSYLDNIKSHEFYERESYHKLGFHFQKKLL